MSAQHPGDPDPRQVDWAADDADRYFEGWDEGYTVGRSDARRAWVIAIGLAIILGFLLAGGRVSATSDAPRSGAPIKAAAEVSRTAVPPGAEVGASIAGGGLRTPVAGRLDWDGGGVSWDGLAQGRTGVIAQAVGHGPSYLAIPIGPGHLVDVCGPASCWRAVSTDAGPARSMLVQGRIADVALGHWLAICGLPAIRGTCRGSWHVVERSTQTLPPTDVAP